MNPRYFLLLLPLLLGAAALEWNSAASPALVPVESLSLVQDAVVENEAAPVIHSAEDLSPEENTLPLADTSLPEEQNPPAPKAAPRERSPFFQSGAFGKAMLFDRDGIRTFEAPTSEAAPIPETPALFFSSLESAQQLAADRESASRAADGGSSLNGSHGNSAPPPPAADRQPLGIGAFEVVSFHPGKRYNGETLQPVVTNIVAALQGPDYNFDSPEKVSDQEQLARLQKIFSLGNGGDLLLKVAGDGYLENEDGFEFTIFQTSSRFGTFLWQKFARVGVSNSADPASFHWFPCDPLAGTLSGCAGVVPTSEGGDRFDLSAVGVSEARYIWIQDTGQNKSFPGKWPNEGISLDALQLHHAYRNL